MFGWHRVYLSRQAYGYGGWLYQSKPIRVPSGKTVQVLIDLHIDLR